MQALHNALPWRSCTQGILADSSLTSLSQLPQALSNCLTGRTTSSTTPFSNPVTLAAISCTYLLILFLFHNYVRLFSPTFPHTPAFVRAAAAHNSFLSLLSLSMLLHALHAVWYTVATTGAAATVCVPPPSAMPPVMQRTLYIFLLSKIYELLDTPIIIARRKPLTLLHVLHHSTVAFEIWGWLDTRFVLGIYGMIFNCFVHTIMYAYYAAILYRRRIPGKVFITLTQIVQFITSFASIVPYVYLHRTTPDGCQGFPGLYLSAAMNATFLVLFILFFLRTYTKKPSKSPATEWATPSTFSADYKTEVSRLKTQ